jgi:hypothetical protein
MWGNSLGWTISAALVVLCGAWLYIIANASKQTPPTDFSRDERNFAALALPAPPSEAFPPAKTGIDATSLYRQAIELYLGDRTTYDDFARRGKLDSPDVAKLQAIDLLVEAAPAREVKLFTSTPAEIVSYKRDKIPLDALKTLGQVCIDRLGLLNQRAGKSDEAMKYYQAGIALGWNLAIERLTYEELALGMELIAKSSAGMARLERNGLSAALREFDRQRIDYQRDHLDPTLRITRAFDAKIVGERTGDVFELAKRSQERMWRVEAILALGRVRHFAGEGGTRANQASADVIVRDLAVNDPDPIIRTAAAAARDLTIEEHRMQ